MDTGAINKQVGVPGLYPGFGMPFSGCQREDSREISDQVSLSCGDSPAARQAEAPPEKAVSHPAVKELCSIRDELVGCQKVTGKNEKYMYKADNSLQDASRNLRFASYNIEKTCFDDPCTDVSKEGILIEKYLNRSVGNLALGDKRADSVSRDTEGLKLKLAESYKRLKELKEGFSNPGEFHAKLMVSKAMELLGETFISADSGLTGAKDLRREVGETISRVQEADGHIQDVKSDGPGRDVSDSGVQINSVAYFARKNIQGMEDVIRGAEMDFHLAGKNIGEAVQSIDGACHFLAHPEDAGEIPPR
jgi:hypothetical protein